MHGRRQNGNPAEWWERYIADKDFRRDEEIAAHCAEAAYVLATATNRNARRAGIAHIADRLSSPIYGSLMAKREALALLRVVSPMERPYGAL